MHGKKNFDKSYILGLSLEQKKILFQLRGAQREVDGIGESNERATGGTKRAAQFDLRHDSARRW